MRKCNISGILHMDTKATDTFKSSEFRLQAVLSRIYDSEPPEGGTLNSTCLFFKNIHAQL